MTAITPTGGVELIAYTRARSRAFAWCDILEAVDEQRQSLDCRIWAEDPDDTLLEADVMAWCQLTDALTSFLEARRMK